MADTRCIGDLKAANERLYDVAKDDMGSVRDALGEVLDAIESGLDSITLDQLDSFLVSLSRSRVLLSKTYHMVDGEVE